MQDIVRLLIARLLPALRTFSETWNVFSEKFFMDPKLDVLYNPLANYFLFIAFLFLLGFLGYLLVLLVRRVIHSAYIFIRIPKSSIPMQAEQSGDDNAGKRIGSKAAHRIRRLFRPALALFSRFSSRTDAMRTDPAYAALPSYDKNVFTWFLVLFTLSIFSFSIGFITGSNLNPITHLVLPALLSLFGTGITLIAERKFKHQLRRISLIVLLFTFFLIYGTYQGTENRDEYLSDQGLGIEVLLD
jgi:hypothetical protein